nr:MAG TPA: hypothetical protein [Caudoviricetes sp.]
MGATRLFVKYLSSSKEVITEFCLNLVIKCE